MIERLSSVTRRLGSDWIGLFCISYLITDSWDLRSSVSALVAYSSAGRR